MIEIPKELLDNIQEAIRQRFRRGENGWEHGEHEEDTLVGDFLGNLRLEKEQVIIIGRLYEWQIVYKNSKVEVKMLMNKIRSGWTNHIRNFRFKK
jgi:hypothetical protein